MQKDIQVIIGPTASGKSALAIDRALSCNGVVINCDAMQCYDALHILTAQPSAADQAQVPHRLYGHLHPATHYSAADWRADAIRNIEQVLAAGQTPVICGGSGFYLKALMDGLSPVPEIPQHVRNKAITRQKELGNPAFHKDLKKRDPETAGRLDPMNTARNLRAWEVLEHTGKPLAAWQAEPLIGPPQDWQFHVTAIFPDRSVLIDRINKRLTIMMDQGIFQEVKTLDDKIQSGEVPANALIVKAHGFRPFRRYLNGEWSLDQAIEWTQTETRQYAKRQMTWLKNQITIDSVISIVI